ncbi:cytochrome P450 protein [Rutstroemia sp. NJR-2017a BBW]|nr:cytochrome P450 protein [Rutstroemia sp. NJR-2017a BBW]
MYVLTFVSVFVASFILYRLFGGSKIRRNGQSLRCPPNTLPLVGNGLVFLQARHKLFSWFVKCERQFGFETFQISVPSLPPGVVINDPKNLEYVFKNEGIFAKGDFVKSRSWDLFDGNLWKVQRKAGLAFLNNSNMKVLTDTALPKYLNEIIAKLGEACSDSRDVDLEAEFHELTTKLMGRMAYDMDMHSRDEFSLAFEYASGATGERFQNPLWPVTEMIFGARFRSSIAKVKAFGAEIVANAVKSRREKIKLESDSLDCISGSLINSLLDSIDDHNTVADAALNYLSAGKQVLAIAYLFLANYSRSRYHCTSLDMDLLSVNAASSGGGAVKHVNETSGIDEKTASTAFYPSAVPYVMSVFYETLRLYPPIPFEIKQCEQAATLPDGTYLPKNAVLVWCPWAMNRSKLIWGDDADQFRPERWIENGGLISKPAFEFPVFNGGPRTCLGKKMAESVVAQVISKLVLHFDFALLDQKERISKNSLTLPMEGGLPCRVQRSPGVTAV